MSVDPKRSALMSRIRGKDTRPERVLRRLLWSEGLRYRVNFKTPAGRPDLVFVGPKVAIFVDGCFWHGCPDHYVRPRSRGDFWSAKLRENVERDSRQTLKLEGSGWRVLRYWEHEVFVEPERLLSQISAAVQGAATAPGSTPRIIKVEAMQEPREMERVHLCDLRDPDDVRTIERVRHTKKW